MAKTQVDETAATELELYATNHSTIYSWLLRCYKNLQSKIDKGAYDPELAPKIFTLVLAVSADLYIKEFCTTGAKYYDTFNKATRDEVARRLARSFEAEIEVGNKF